jgi:hypothetical protein
MCSSTCTIFANHMLAKGVKAVAFGGRPQPGPMQSIGGTKGSEVLELETISAYSELAQGLVGNASLTAAELDLWNETAPIPLANFPLVLGSGSVNFRNAFGPSNDVVPAQFIYEAADCRLFYTPASVTNPEAYWAAAATAVWGNGTCVNSLRQSEGTPADLGIVDSVSNPGTHQALGLLIALGKGINNSS